MGMMKELAMELEERRHNFIEYHSGSKDEFIKKAKAQRIMNDDVYPVLVDTVKNLARDGYCCSLKKTDGKRDDGSEHIGGWELRIEKSNYSGSLAFFVDEDKNTIAFYASVPVVSDSRYRAIVGDRIDGFDYIRLEDADNVSIKDEIDYYLKAFREEWEYFQH